MARLLRRSHLPLGYTEGFNPHPHVVFALPLPLGLEGVRESMDVRFEDDGISNRTVETILKDFSTSDIIINEVTNPIHKAKEITGARYVYEGVCADDTAGALYGTCRDFFGQETILIQKKTKSGRVSQIDIKPVMGFGSLWATAVGAAFELTLPAGDTLNIHPHALLDSLNAKIAAPPPLWRVTRKDLLLADGQPFS